VAKIEKRMPQRARSVLNTKRAWARHSRRKKEGEKGGLGPKSHKREFASKGARVRFPLDLEKKKGRPGSGEICSYRKGSLKQKGGGMGFSVNWGQLSWADNSGMFQHTSRPRVTEKITRGGRGEASEGERARNWSKTAREGPAVKEVKSCEYPTRDRNLLREGT